jgi:hypothetical protein
MNSESRVENVNTWLVLAAILALTMAVGVVTLIYAYMDHTNSIISLRVGQHDMRCLHEQCWLTEHAK